MKGKISLICASLALTATMTSAIATPSRTATKQHDGISELCTVDSTVMVAPTVEAGTAYVYACNSDAAVVVVEEPVSFAVDSSRFVGSATRSEENDCDVCHYEHAARDVDERWCTGKTCGSKAKNNATDLQHARAAKGRLHSAFSAMCGNQQ